jgi:hypothetical protein
VIALYNTWGLLSPGVVQRWFTETRFKFMSSTPKAGPSSRSRHTSLCFARDLTALDHLLVEAGMLVSGRPGWSVGHRDRAADVSRGLWMGPCAVGGGRAAQTRR